LITKTELDKLVEKYETKEFIESDPIQLPHRYNSEEDIELVGFISSLFAFGSRKVFIKKLDFLFDKMQGMPVNYIKSGDFGELKDFQYRFAKDVDIIGILTILNKLYTESKGLKELFNYGYSEGKTIIKMLKIFTDYFYANADKTVQSGFYFMLANPDNKGAMKRLNMYLRWMVRKSVVDFGIWDFVPKSELLIPLDTHVAKISREMNLLTRKSNDFNAVLELTNKLREFDPKDPVKYDFAIYAKGINS